jgi:hypothetical protein
VVSKLYNLRGIYVVPYFTSFLKLNAGFCMELSFMMSEDTKVLYCADCRHTQQHSILFRSQAHTTLLFIVEIAGTHNTTVYCSDRRHTHNITVYCAD